MKKSGDPPPKYNKYNSTDALRLGTRGGAEAWNLSHFIGTIEVGKNADLVVFDRIEFNLTGVDGPFEGVGFHDRDGQWRNRQRRRQAV